MLAFFILLDYDTGMSEKQEIFTLLNGRVQMARGVYNPTSDAVWLAAYIPRKPKNVLDVGIGTGGVALCLLAHYPDTPVTGIDISDEMLADCKTNAELNKANIILENQDIYKWSTTSRYDIVVTNPPYFDGTPSAKNNAHHNIDFTRWIKKCCARVNSNGYICVISDMLHMDKTIAVLNDKHFGDIQIFPLFGASNITAERVLIRGKQDSNTGATIYSGTSMNNERVLRDGLTVDALLTMMKQS